MALSNKVQFLREELESLRQDGARQRAKLRYLRKNTSVYAEKTTSSHTLEDAFQFCKDKLPPHLYNFFRVQLFTILKPRWNETSLNMSILASRSGKKVYNSLSTIFRLPCNATIRRYKCTYDKFEDNKNSGTQDSSERQQRGAKKINASKTLPKSVRSEIRKNKSVAQILEDFLGKQSSDYDVVEEEPPYIISSIQDDELISSESNASRKCVSSVVGSDVIAGVVSSRDTVGDDLGGPDSLVEPDNGSLLARPLVVGRSVLNKPNSGYIMKPMRMEDGTVAYMYDL